MASRTGRPDRWTPSLAWLSARTGALLSLGPPLRPALALRAAGAVPHAAARPPLRRRDRVRGRSSSAACSRPSTPASRRTAPSSIVTSDHGESLGEHGEATHAFSIYDATQRVPLLMAGPGLPAGARRDGASRGSPTWRRQCSSWPAAARTHRSDRQRACCPSYAASRRPSRASPGSRRSPPSSTSAGARCWAFARWSTSTCVRRVPSSTRWRRTRGRRGISPAKQPGLASRLDAQVEARGAARKAAPNLAVDPEVTERLRALGYVAAEAPPSSGRALGEVGGRDPKDEIGKFGAIMEALSRGRPAETLELLAGLGEVGLEIELLRGRGRARRRRLRARTSFRATGQGSRPEPCALPRAAGSRGRGRGPARRRGDRLPRRPRAGGGYRGGVDRARTRGRSGGPTR